MTLLPALPSGTRIGPYTVDRPIGRGATALVLLAHDGAGAQVAVKIRPRGVPAADRRFLREFESMRALRQPGVVRVHEAGMDGRHVWFSMEYVDGVTFLEAASEPGTAEERVDRALDLGCQLLDVLSRLHAAGLAHRDIKPSNVLVDKRGRVQVLDFGIGRFFDRGSRGGDEGTGTMPYMAPEQLAGLRSDHRVDLFATGLMIYESLAGRRPSPANPLGWVTRTCLDRPIPLASTQPRCPRRLSNVVERLLDVHPPRRPEAADAVAELRRVRREPDSQDWPEPPFVDPGAWWNRLEAALSEPSDEFVWILDGSSGSGRRRAVEQLQRHALLQGIRTVHVRCDATSVGGPVLEALEALLGGGEDESWIRRVVGSGTGTLRQMWPHLPLPPEGVDEPMPTMTRVAEAAAEVLARAAAEVDLLLVVHALEQVDLLSARTLHRLAVLADRALGMVLLHDPRWATPLSEQVVGGLRARHDAGFVAVPPLDSESASALRASICPEAPNEARGKATPQRAVEDGYATLARWRGESWEAPGAHLWPLAVYEPVPELVLVELVGAGVLTSPWVRRTTDGVVLAGATARRAARSRLADLRAAANAMADAWHDAVGPDAQPDVQARLRLLAGTPRAARPSAARAAFQALATGRYADARRWLFLHDALPGDGGSGSARPDFQLASAKAQVALVTEADEPRDLLVQACEAAARTAEEQAGADILLAQYQLRRGEVRPALVAALRTASPGRAPSHPIAVEALLLATRCRMRLAQWDDARAQLTRAEALLTAVGPENVLASEVAHLRAELLLVTQELDAAGAQAESLLVRARRASHLRNQARAAHLLARVLRLVGRRRRAEGLARSAVQAAVQCGDLALAAETRLTLATLLVERGDAGAARPLLDAAIRRLRGLRLDHVLPRALRVVLQVAVARNDPHEADVALATFRNTPSADAEAPATLVRWWRGRGDHQAALSVDPPAPGTWAHLLWQIERARVLLVGGAFDRAAQEAEQAREAALERGFDELELYGRLIAHAASDPDAATWEETVREAASHVWTELCFGALELDARRRAAAGDVAGANRRWQALRTRCEELGYHPGWEEAAGWLDTPS